MLKRTASKLGWIGAYGCLASGMSGCASHPTLSSFFSNGGALAVRSTIAPSEQSSSTIVKKSLAMIAYDQRQATSLEGATAPLLGRIIADSPPIFVRELSLSQCESMAIDSAPVARQLRQHAQWLDGHKQTTLSAAMQEQARFEADKHRLLAIEAFLNLANVHAQTTVVDQGLSFVSDLRGSVAEFRRAGVEVAVTNNQLERQVLAIQESIVELQYNQNRLIDGLETLLQIAPQAEPIWVAVSDQFPISAVDSETAFDFAQQHRGDLQALRILSANADSIPAETLQQLHPLLSTGVPIPSVSWWMCMKKREAECLERSQRQQRQQLLDAMVAAKIEQIRTEVQTCCLALHKIESLLELKVQQRALLREAQQSRTQRAQGQIDITDYIADSQQDLKWTSEIISLMFDQQIELARLQQAMGHRYQGP